MISKPLIRPYFRWGGPLRGVDWSLNEYIVALVMFPKFRGKK